MWDVNSVNFFDLLLQLCGTYIVGSISFEDQLFSSFIDRLGFSPRLFYFKIFSSIFEMGDELVYSLTGNLEIPSNLDNRLFPHPLSDDPLNVPIR